MIAIFHNIRSIHNVGSMFRTADAAGITKIYLCGITPTPIDRFGRKNTRFTKVSLGAENSVMWEKAASTATLITKLKKEGYTIFALEQSTRSIPYTSVRVKRKERERTALVMGNEVEGVSASIMKKCDMILEIPMHGVKESLNVGVAFGIAAFHLTK